MTIIESSRPQADAADAALWHEVEKDFWVGSVKGAFLGTIEAHGAKRFFARDAVRAYVGEYKSLPEARTAIAAASR